MMMNDDFVRKACTRTRAVYPTRHFREPEPEQEGHPMRQERAIGPDIAYALMVSEPWKVNDRVVHLCREDEARARARLLNRIMLRQFGSGAPLYYAVSVEDGGCRSAARRVKVRATQRGAMAK